MKIHIASYDARKGYVFEYTATEEEINALPPILKAFPQLKGIINRSRAMALVESVNDSQDNEHRKQRNENHTNRTSTETLTSMEHSL